MTLEGVLQGKRVHDRREHADIVGLGAVHALGRTRQTAEDVAAADDDSELNAVMHDVGDLLRQIVDDLGIDPIAQIARESFSGKLEQHAIVFIFLRHEQRPFSRNRSLILYILTERTTPAHPLHAKSQTYERIAASHAREGRPDSRAGRKPKRPCGRQNVKLRQ